MIGSTGATWRYTRAHCPCSPGRRRSPASYVSSPRCYTSSAAWSGWATSARTSPNSYGCRATRRRRTNDILDTIERMGQLARSQASKAKQAFATRNVTIAQELVGLDGEIERLNRAIFNRAVDVGDDLEVREWAMFMILVARCLERIAGNSVDIAEQTDGVRRDRTVPRIRYRTAARIDSKPPVITRRPRGTENRRERLPHPVAAGQVARTPTSLPVRTERQNLGVHGLAPSDSDREAAAVDRHVPGTPAQRARPPSASYRRLRSRLPVRPL